MKLWQAYAVWVSDWVFLLGFSYFVAGMFWWHQANPVLCLMILVTSYTLSDSIELIALPPYYQQRYLESLSTEEVQRLRSLWKRSWLILLLPMVWLFLLDSQSKSGFAMFTSLVGTVETGVLGLIGLGNTTSYLHKLGWPFTNIPLWKLPRINKTCNSDGAPHAA